MLDYSTKHIRMRFVQMGQGFEKDIRALDNMKVLHKLYKVIWPNEPEPETLNLPTIKKFRNHMVIKRNKWMKENWPTDDRPWS